MKTGGPLPVDHLLDGRYRIHKLLGVGGMGRVYLANDTRLANRPVAVKEMLIGDGAQERKAVEDFQREASVLARLSHPSIPQIIDYFGEQGRHYLVMEYVAGGDLQQRLDDLGPQARMPEATVVAMARQLLEVLHFLHSQNPPIIYRDLKPGNIMIDHQGRAMLIDFGIARFLPPGGRGTQIGSVGYAPPEQYLGKMEPRSDLYALAATMHHLLTGRDPQLQPPFSFPPIRDLAPAISQQTARVIMAALDKELTNRPASALEMRDLLPSEGQNSVTPAPAGTAKPRASMAAVATVILDRPVASPRLPTPRSITLEPVASAPVAQSRPVLSPIPFPVGTAGQSPKFPPSKPAATMVTQRGIQPPQSRNAPGTSSTSKTADFGLKKNGNVVLSTLPGPAAEQKKGFSRVAAAIASMRAAITAGPVTTTASASPTHVVDTPFRTPGGLANPKRPADELRVPSSIEDAGNKKSSMPAVAGARLVSVADGVQFGIFGSRLVLGRAHARTDGVDIDLSRLRRGTDRISRRHAEIIKQGNDYFVRDLGSVNGTYIAGRGRLGRDQLYKLKDRDELIVGGAKLEFRCK